VGADVRCYYHDYIFALGEWEGVVCAVEREVVVDVCVGGGFACWAVLICWANGLEEDGDGGRVECFAV